MKPTAPATATPQPKRIECNHCRRLLGLRQGNIFVASVGVSVLIRLAQSFTLQHGFEATVEFKREVWFGVTEEMTFAFDRTHQIKCGHCLTHTKFKVNSRQN